MALSAWAYLDPQQLKPSAATRTTLYTVPASTEAIVTNITVTNVGTANDAFELSISPAGVSFDAALHVFEKDVTVRPDAPAFEMISAKTLAAGTIVRCYSDNGDLIFHLFGMTRTPA